MERLIAYLILVAVTVYTAVIYNSAPMLFFAGVEFFLPLLLFLMLLVQTLRLKLQPMDMERFFDQNEQRPMCFLARNRTRFPIRRLSLRVKYHNLTTGETRTKRVKTALDRGEGRVSVPWEPLQPGIWRVSAVRIRVYDFWKLWRLPKRSVFGWELTQLPARHEICLIPGAAQEGSAWESQEYHPHKSGNDSSYIRETREYRPGDSLKSIHWKLSAKRETLLVKEFGLPLSCSLLLGLSGEGLSDKLLELVYSLLWGCRELERSLLLLWQGQKGGEPCLMPVFQDEDVYLAMEFLMRENLAPWDQAPKPEVPSRQLWLEEGRLIKDGVPVEDFSGEDWKERLAGMELIL